MRALRDGCGNRNFTDLTFVFRTSMRSIRSSCLIRLWTWRAFVFLYRKRSMNRSSWATLRP